jgi:hypothetical protein
LAARLRAILSQYSLGKSKVVASRVASVITQILTPFAVLYALNIRRGLSTLKRFSLWSASHSSPCSSLAWRLINSCAGSDIEGGVTALGDGRLLRRP